MGGIIRRVPILVVPQMKVSRVTSMVLFVCLLVGLPSRAELVVENAWSRATVPAARSGAVYATLRNTGSETVTITGLASDAARMPMQIPARAISLSPRLMSRVPTTRWKPHPW